MGDGALEEGGVTSVDAERSLEDRLRLLEDERAVLQTLHRYGHSIDYGLEDDWIDCFTEDGAFDVRREDPPGARHEGRAALAAFVAQHTRAPEHWHKHLLVEPSIAIDGDRASATSYFVRVDHLDDRPQIRSFGRYHDRLVRCPDGRWRFEERIAEVEARHPMSR